MSWADSVTEPTGRSSRPARPSYIPPHLRSFNNNNNGVTVDTVFEKSKQFWSINDSSSCGHRFNHSGYGEPSRGGSSHGRGRGRGRRSGGRHRQFHDTNANPNPNPFDVVEKFDELEVVDDSDVGGGINFDAYEDIPVETSGSNIPPPVNSFAETDLGKALNDNIKRCKFN